MLDVTAVNCYLLCVVWDRGGEGETHFYLHTQWSWSRRRGVVLLCHAMGQYKSLECRLFDLVLHIRFNGKTSTVQDTHITLNGGGPFRSE